MGRLNAWLNDNRQRTWVGDKGRPASVGNIILDKPVSISIVRQSSTTQATSILAAQTVRIDTFQTPFHGKSEIEDLAVNDTHKFVLLGYKNHPTVADTNVQTGDRFKAYGRYYSVLKVESSMTDRVLAIIEEQE